MLIRHGQTDWNLIRRMQGHIDIPMNRIGRSQAKLLAQKLADCPLEAIYTSDLARAQETAEIIARPLGLTPIPQLALRERLLGRFQGLTIEEARVQYPDDWQQVREKGAAPPGGESRQEVATRVRDAFNEIVERHTDQQVAIVSHGGVLQLLIAWVVGLPLGQPARISLSGNTGISIIEKAEDGKHRLASLNDTGHLQSISTSNRLNESVVPAEVS
jgi:broad specificity phosphatase PhoE